MASVYMIRERTHGPTKHVDGSPPKLGEKTRGGSESDDRHLHAYPAVLLAAKQDAPDAPCRRYRQTVPTTPKTLGTDYALYCVDGTLERRNLSGGDTMFRVAPTHRRHEKQDKSQEEKSEPERFVVGLCFAGFISIFIWYGIFKLVQWL